MRHQLLDWILISVATISIVWSAYKIREWIHNVCCSPVSYMIVTGKRHYTTDIDINQLIVKLGVLGTFITQDVNIIQKQIESLPWIQQVSVRKQWPDTLKVHITEYIPLAYWNDLQTISTTGIIFRVPKEYRDNDKKVIPSLYGPEGSERVVLANYYVLNEILKSIKFQIKSVQMDTRCSWQLVLQDNIHLKLGRNNIIGRLYYFIKIYPILIQKINDHNTCIDYIDLRYRSGCAVRWGSHSITPVLCSK
ncbi:cell division protein FtsQ/DivIB [Blochmannia endosymbiont of Camponotus sp.]|uniref:cell division protein FtsQ/DivIB n=1 Tax=Blochmannia endosymbiont of Camponotus sp. TaxID=700220 RepID=UPI0020242F30|nr:cell division protein FtsQ/DivIB [Blochmannia endosymbiont of Camponotus sp.]URJ24065.1 cell division protein FtsQ/DivIB [Blochmannia endosymbiont of Camponotus sp.]URJ25741.1 cell division protein FtsQ/DivIB [Blochmannia endosymbiont of Camponotus sp.]